ncbi:MAG: formylglycine-generating enzyme family protein [Nitrospiria bacterium]
MLRNRIDVVLAFMSALPILLTSCLIKTPPQPPPPGMVAISAGTFLRGSDKVDVNQQASELGTLKPWYLDEHPAHQLHLPLFYIDKFEVTNTEYKLFIDATHSRPPVSFFGRSFPPGRQQYPVTDINWYEASRYCEWKGKRLPTEAEWEKAARGTDGREFPWGNDYDKKKLNAGDSGIGDIAPIGSFQEGASPYGVMDMSGNVWEWTADWYQPYPDSTYQAELFGEKQKVFRGGGWGGIGHYALPLFYRTAYRSSIPPEEAYADLGFRCAKSP